MQELCVFIFLDRSLDFIECLFHKLAVLHVENPVSIALDLWVMRHHHTCRCTLLAFTLRSHSVDVEDEVHDCH